jgi:hypothetical protein
VERTRPDGRNGGDAPHESVAVWTEDGGVDAGWDFCAPVGAFGSSGWFAAASLHESRLLRLLKALTGDKLLHAIGCIYFFHPATKFLRYRLFGLGAAEQRFRKWSRRAESLEPVTAKNHHQF